MLPAIIVNPNLWKAVITMFQKVHRRLNAWESQTQILLTSNLLSPFKTTHNYYYFPWRLIDVLLINVKLSLNFKDVLSRGSSLLCENEQNRGLVYKRYGCDCRFNSYCY